MLKTAMKLIVLGAVTAAVLGVAWWWYTFYQDQTETHTVDKGRISGVIISGTLRCRQRTHVRSEVQATVKKWHVQEGQEVQAGDLLVVLDDALVAEDRARAAAQVAQAQARLEELIQGPREAEIKGAQEAEKKAVAAYNHAVAQYQRFRHSAGASTASEIENYKTRATIAKAELGEVRSRLELLQAGTREEQKAQARAQLDLARAQLNRVKALQDKYTIRAAHKGKVTKTFPHEREMVTPNQDLLLLHNFESMEVYGHAQESLQSRIRPSDTALVRPDAFPEREFEARVVRILPRVEENRGTMTVKLAFLKQPGVDLPDGGTVDIVLIGDTQSEVIRVPIEAVRGSGDKTFVWLEQDGRFVRREIQTGREDGKMVEVREGLEPGQVIRMR